MYQLKVRIAGEAWQICLVLISTLMCMLAVFDRPSSPIGLIGIVFALIAAVVPLGMRGSWNRHYYSALATFPIMAVAILLANTVFRPLAAPINWSSIAAAIAMILLIVFGYYRLSSFAMNYLDKYDRRKIMQ